MAVRQIDNDVYFNTPLAVKRLLGGDKPEEVFKHPGFQSQLPILSDSDLRVSRLAQRLDVKKAMAGTLQVAVCADLAHEFMKTTPIETSFGDAYTLDTEVDESLIRDTFMPQFRIIVSAMGVRINAFRADNAPSSPIFDKTLHAMERLVEPSPIDTRRALAYRISVNADTPTQFVPAYSNLLHNLYRGETGDSPTVNELMTLTENSTSILGIIAAQNVIFMNTCSENIEDPLVLGEKFYRPEKFRLLLPPDHKLSARMKRDTRIEVEKEYQERQAANTRDGIFVTTECPAEPELIEALVRQYTETVRFNAKAT